MAMESFDLLLEESTRIHGHVCPGQVLGVRLSLLGLKMIGISDPKGHDRRKIYVYVEIDRCATDAIQSVTGCSVGKRTLKLLDHGVMAATFVNLETDKAVRITALEESRESSKKYCSHILDKKLRQLEAYKIMPDEELFSVQHVAVKIPPHDLPGKPIKRVQCQACGDWVQDNRDMVKDGRIICRRCSGERYFSLL